MLSRWWRRYAGGMITNHENKIKKIIDFAPKPWCVDVDFHHDKGVG